MSVQWINVNKTNFTFHWIVSCQVDSIVQPLNSCLIILTLSCIQDNYDVHVHKIYLVINIMSFILYFQGE